MYMIDTEEARMKRVEAQREILERELELHRDRQARIEAFIEQNTCPHCKQCKPIPYHIQY